MSDTKPAPAKSRPEAIAVRVLKLAHAIDVGHKAGASSVTASGQKNQDRFEIEYQPWLRHHKVTCYSAGSDEPSAVEMIHETHVLSWRPMT